jgi:hypothetical protein
MTCFYTIRVFESTFCQPSALPVLNIVSENRIGTCELFPAYTGYRQRLRFHSSRNVTCLRYKVDSQLAVVGIVAIVDRDRATVGTSVVHKAVKVSDGLVLGESTSSCLLVVGA